MDNFKPKWGASFGISFAAHCAVFALLGLVLHFGPTAIPPKEIIEVDLVNMGGGGGGGGTPLQQAAEEGPKISAPEAEHPTAPPPEPQAQPDPEAENDVHEIVRPTEPTSQPQGPVSSNRSQTSSAGDGGNGGGTGGGDGPGNGPGQGPGDGGGSGGGSGGGNGPGNGPGDGPGDGVTMGPQVLSASKPNYPESARRNNIEGTTMVGLTISDTGSVTNAWVVSSSGNGELDAAAVQAVYNWQFVPAKQNGQAITVNSTVPITFNLH